MHTEEKTLFGVIIKLVFINQSQGCEDKRLIGMLG